MDEDSQRKDDIVACLQDSFADLMESDPDAFRTKFRKMAKDPFAFYRGTACLFYADLAGTTHLDSALTGDDSAWWGDHGDRVWIQGDLHVENFGTYMAGDGRLVFDVNDFDEAYVAPWTWDIRRFVASLALICWQKALPNEIIDDLVRTYVCAYVDQVQEFTQIDEVEWALTLHNTEGVVLDTLQKAKMSTREAFLAQSTVVERYRRRFADGHGTQLQDAERDKIIEAFTAYQDTIAVDETHSQINFDVLDTVALGALGIGSAGLPAYSVLIEGESQALGNDVVITLKQGQHPSLERVITDSRIHHAFDHQGHRTTVSQRALQGNTSPYLGWTEIDGTGFAVSEFSPYEMDLSWDDLTEPSDMEVACRQLGQATAKIHCVGDDSDHDLVDVCVEDVIAEGVGDDIDSFVEQMRDFAHGYARQVRVDHHLFVDAFRSDTFDRVDPVGE